MSDILLLYLQLLLLGAALCYVLEHLRNYHQEWHLSRSRLMCCRKCGQVFLLKRQAQHRRCPACGGASGDFRYPHSELRQKLH